MSEIRDGGPAFPSEDRPIAFKQGHEECAKALSAGINHGMSLRDYFAAHALQGILSNAVITGAASMAEKKVEKVTDAFSQWAYQYADAMLKARESK